MKKILAALAIISMISCAKDKKSKTESLSGTESVPDQTHQEEPQNEVANAINDVFNSEIKMEVDETVFVIDNGTNRVTEDMSAGIMTMLAPQTYDQLKKQLEEKPDNGDGSTFLSLEEKELEGKKVLVQKSEVTDEVGDKMMMMMYALPAGEKTMMISAFFMKEEASKYIPLIEKSVLSARLEK